MGHMGERVVGHRNYCLDAIQSSRGLTMEVALKEDFENRSIYITTSESYSTNALKYGIDEMSVKGLSVAS